MIKQFLLKKILNQRDKQPQGFYSMDQIQKSLCDMIKQKPDCLTDRNILRAVLADSLPSNKLQQNLLLNAYDLDIVKGLSNSSDKTLAALNLISQMENDFGVKKDPAIWVISTWCYLLALDEVCAALSVIQISSPSAEATYNAAFSTSSGLYKMDMDEGIYFAGIDFPEGEVKLTSLYKNQSKEIYFAILEKGSSSNKILTNGFFKTHAWLTVKKGQRLEVGGKVTLSAYGGIA